MSDNRSFDIPQILRNGFVGGVLSFYTAIIGMTELFSARNLVGTFISLGEVMVFGGAFTAGILMARSISQKPKASIALSGALAGVVAGLLLVLISIIQAFFSSPPEWILDPQRSAPVLVVFILGGLIAMAAPGFLRDKDSPRNYLRHALFGLLGALLGWAAFIIFSQLAIGLNNLREIFINLSPALTEILTLGVDNLWLGSLLLLLICGLFGLIGSGIVVLPDRLWRAFFNASVFILIVGLFSENFGAILQQLFGRGFSRMVFRNDTLHPIAALILFVAIFSFTYFGVRNRTSTRWSRLSPDQQTQGRRILLILGIVLLLAMPWIVGRFLSQVLFIVGLYVMMGLGLNIVVGFAGLLDLGYVAFFAFGAYTMGILTSTGELGVSGLNFWTSLPVAVIVGVGFGVLLGFPVLRMRGDYLAIVTLGFGEIIRILALSDWLAPLGGGAQGVLHIPEPAIGSFEFNIPELMYYLVIIGSLLAAFVSIRLRESRLGRQWMAMREDEDVAEAMGINLVQTKLLAFAIGAGFSALAGAIFSARLGNIFPHSFNLLISLNALALIIVGGMGSIPGVVVGALILVGMPELLREFSEYRLLMYGILLIVMMLAKPEGFWPEAHRRRELHAVDEIDLVTEPIGD